MDYIFLALFGVLGGLIAGLLGVGGGVVYILILPSFLRTAGVCEEEIVTYVVSNSVFTVFFVSIAANVKSLLNKTFEYSKVLLIGITGAVSSILAMEYIVRASWYSKLEFNIAVSFLMILMLMRIFKKTEHEEPKVNHPFFYIVIGLIAGLASALSGLGGGVIVVPLMIYLYGNSVHEAKTTSLGVIGIMAFALSIKNMLSTSECGTIEYSSGYIVFPVALLLSLGVVFGTPIGVKISKLISEQILRYLFALMLLVVIVKKFYEIAIVLQWL